MSYNDQNKGEEIVQGKQDTIGITRDTSPVSPIHALVPDILVAIFAQALHEQEEVDYQSGWNRMVPMNVSAVCHQWRMITLASPILWSTIKGFEGIGVPWDSWGLVSKYPWKHFELFLRRSEQAPLDISMELRSDSRADDALLLSALHDNQTRLRSIYFHFEILDDYRKSRVSGPKQTLSNLSIVEDIHMKCLGKAPISLKLKHAPSLRCLRLNGISPLSLDTDIILHNLVRVELSNASGLWVGSSVHECIMLLQASPSIEDFSASGIFIDSLRPKPDGISVCLSRLSVFSLTGITSETARAMLEALTLPGLHELVINVDDVLLSSTCGVHSLLERSNAVLETLNICIPNISETTQCLQSSPDLQTLSLSYYGWGVPETDDLLKCLTLGSGVQTCPRLKNIIFDSYYNYTFEDLAITMIQSRWSRQEMEKGSALETVVFRNCEGGEFVSLKLAESRKQGLEIIVTDCRDNDLNNSDIESLDDYDWDEYDDSPQETRYFSDSEEEYF